MFVHGFPHNLGNLLGDSHDSKTGFSLMSHSYELESAEHNPVANVFCYTVSLDGAMDAASSEQKLCFILDGSSW